MERSGSPLPFNEDFRQAVLDSYGVLDSPPEQQFDRLTRLAVHQFGVPIALISLVDRERQWFKSRQGLEAEETPRELAFCAHAILCDEPLVVPNATEDPRFSGNPLVTGAANIRFYAGAPLIAPEGARLGTFCIIDRKARGNPEQEVVQALQDFAALTVDLLQLRRGLAASTTEAAQKLERAARAADAGERAKRQFMAIAGHELRTPLNAIMGFSELLSAPNGQQMEPARHEQYVAAIRSAGDRLSRVVDSVLSYSQAERGELELHEEVFDPADVLGDCLNACAGDAALKNLGLSIAVEAASLPLLRADRLQTEQMLLQLLSNAIEASPEGGFVTAGVERDSDGALVLSVCDDGPGIGDQDLPRALKAFSQISEGLGRTGEGMGLGLPLTQRLIELHGGSFGIGRQADGGTRAVLRFPAFRILARD